MVLPCQSVLKSIELLGLAIRNQGVQICKCHFVAGPFLSPSKTKAMTFSVNETHLLQDYTYEVTTEDEERFVCTRQIAPQGEAAEAPPEKLWVDLGEEPRPDVWGKSLAALYTELLQKITEYVQKRTSQP